MKWKKKDIPSDLVKSISAKYGCDLLTASVFVRRGITTGEAIRFFLEDDVRYLHNPFELPGMEEAVERILAAKEEGEKVLIFGDADVDGITGTVLLADYLKSIGIDVSWRIPSGEESYGLSIKAVEEFAAAYGTLIITVDCGISRTAEIKRANELSVNVIVTDHHEPQEELPEALSIVNPKLKDSSYSFRDLSGCGVAFKLVSALRFARKSEYFDQPICLLNTRPVNDAWIVEVAKIRNLAVTETLIETIVPGMVGIGETRLPAFLEGQQILVWDAPLQKRVFEKLFGRSVEVGMLDLAPEIGKDIPRTAGKGLLRIKELSKIVRYSDREFTELDVFVNLFKAFVRIRENLGSLDEDTDFQLAALGTIADIMPLRDENRIIVQAGLKSLEAKPGPGLAELLAGLKLQGRHFDAKEISWKLCPVINAARRMGKPEKAIGLFFETDPAQRVRLARELIALNEDRKILEEEVRNIAEPMARENLLRYNEKLTIVYGEEINKGVTGLVAQSFARRFNVPAIAVSFGEDVYTGSLRSARSYDLGFLLERCGDLFIDSGGHKSAAGFSIEKKNWDSFLERLETVAASIEFDEDEGGQAIQVDAELPLDYLRPEIFRLVD
ncbi:MAG: single-stranded-DNA-specific exonuclease RecJ, partial [Treponema sp.]|nr:single-stranded-DNA-specific exonuclease RecJ [Treponema sp.]